MGYALDSDAASEIVGALELEKKLAAAIHRALEISDHSGFVEGVPERTIIDGTFNLEAVAKQVLWDLRKVLPLS